MKNSQNLQKEKGRASRLCCEARPDGASRTSLRRVRLEPESLLADVKKHRLCRIDTEKLVADGAADLRMLVLEVSPIVFLQNAKHLIHFSLVGRVEQNVRHVVPQIRATVMEDGERTIPCDPELRLQDIAELLPVDLCHKASFQDSGLSSHCGPISIYSKHNNNAVSSTKPKNRNSCEFLFRNYFENFNSNL
ncbi:MAG: hypothetical protein CEN89_138 [Candidatus Berkelbacteria bacterium Licking1014_7]|uniref:Uncharacterized protein n=1 Tax=Candidatus Berkelbacteria bacterium Licking1014_7 TaxID=2017147 RepID=A0A554LKE5_9BACT|nr:MAG: hypothetical protein CEN89_138 [Candidatus Berkelbacteria bacterium Licking1014_7]